MRRSFFTVNILFLFFLSLSVYSQSLNEVIKSEYIVTFGKYIKGYNYNHGDTFLVGYFGRNMAQYNAFIKFSKGKKVKGRVVDVVKIRSLRKVEKIRPQILFVAKDKCRETRKIYEHIKGKHILLVTDYCEDSKFSMMNFLPLLYVRLQLNHALLEREGFKVPTVLASIAARYKEDWKTLFVFTEDSLKQEKEMVEKQQEVLDKLNKDIAKQKKELTLEQQEVKEKLALVDSLQKEITTKEKIIEKKENQLVKVIHDLKLKQQVLQKKEKENKIQQQILEEKISKVNKLEKILEKKKHILANQNEEISKQKKELSSFAEKIEKQKLINSFIIILSVILVFFLVFVSYHYIHKRKANRLLAEQNAQILLQKEEIQAQAEQMEEKNKLLQDLYEEIQKQADELFATNQQLSSLNQELQQRKEQIELAHNELRSSIAYAERIQKSILPKNENLKLLVKDAFLIYYPKDIVSGDFYWWIETEKKKYIAVADCTGHGVPGAFMSMLGITLLYNIIKTHPFLLPGEILNLLREGVIKALSQKSKNKQKDGMDIALLAMDKKSKDFEYAGANNPCYVVVEKNSQIHCKTNCERIKYFEEENDNYVLIELRPDKMPIGIYEKMDNFSTITFSYDKDVLIYLFSDGYADQFGGERGKKFKYKSLKKLLLSLASYEMQKQKEIIEKTFVTWKGNNEQVDDVSILGVRL